MSRGRPDWTNLSVIKGEYGTDLKVVALDSSGRIIMVPYGTLQVEGAVDVTQLDSTRTIQGIEGITLHTISVDSLGQIITILKGASGNNVLVDANGFLNALMKGNYGGSPVTLAVDASGNIVAIMKGSYNGVPTTMATDDQGRMLAVLTDPADVFGNPHFMGGAELAARLGSISKHDRRGEIIYADDMKNGVASWYPYSGAGGGSVTHSRARGKESGTSMKITTPTSAGVAQAAYRLLPYPVLGKIGLEASFTLDPATTIVTMPLQIYTGTTYKLGALEYSTVENKLRITNSAGGLTDIATIDLYELAHYLFHTWKIVVDFSTGKYVRAVLNNNSYDLSAYDCYSQADSTAPYLIFGFRHYGASNTVNYWTNVIVTQNEDG